MLPASCCFQLYVSFSLLLMVVCLMQCKVCMQTFICTTSEVKCREHAEAKHPNADVYACFPHLKKWYWMKLGCDFQRDWFLVLSLINMRRLWLSSKFFLCSGYGEMFQTLGSCCFPEYVYNISPLPHIIPLCVYVGCVCRQLYSHLLNPMNVTSIAPSWMLNKIFESHW